MVAVLDVMAVAVTAEITGAAEVVVNVPFAEGADKPEILAEIAAKL
jgi:hypothetical protein